jgi:hypothetical protein
MKKVLFTCALLVSGFLVQAQGLTEDERKSALEYLKQTSEDLKKSVTGLSEEQLNFKSTPESWSVAECVEHLAISENRIFGALEMSLKEEADPSKRSEVKMTDDAIKGFITDRSTKVKTNEAFVPSGQFNSFKGSLDEFESKRNNNIDFVKNTSEDLRNHYFTFPFGTVDAYQILVFMCGHTNRHTQQIEEVKAHANFPKKGGGKKTNSKKSN